MLTKSHRALMSRLRAGDEDAAAEIVGRFRQRLLALARRRLDKDVLRRVDPEDVVQLALYCFFTRIRDRRLAIEDESSAWSILCSITVRKCINQVEYFRAACRDVRREVRLSDLDPSRLLPDAPGREPSPEEAARLNETLDRLTGGLEPRDRAVVLLHLQSYTQAEISQQTGRAERTIRRTLELARQRLRRMQTADEPAE